MAKNKKDAGKKDGRGKSKKKKVVAIVQPPKDYVPRMSIKYKDEVIPALQKTFGFKNPMQIPKMEKVVLNVGIGDAHNDQRLLESVVEEIETITGQKAVITRARKSISNFKLREGMQVGVRVTLRRYQMWEFMDTLFNITIPRIRDFRGLSDKSFDGMGNYSFGIKEQIVFPEINYDKVAKIHGMDITLVTSAATDEEGRALLKELGFPFRKKKAEADLAEQLG